MLAHTSVFSVCAAKKKKKLKKELCRCAARNQVQISCDILWHTENMEIFMSGYPIDAASFCLQKKNAVGRPVRSIPNGILHFGCACCAWPVRANRTTENETIRKANRNACSSTARRWMENDILNCRQTAAPTATILAFRFRWRTAKHVTDGKEGGKRILVFERIEFADS